MSELEPNDSRVVHGNAKPEQGDERFAQKPEQAEQADGSQRDKLDDDAVRNPEQAPSKREEGGEDGRQHEQSIDNDGQFEASELDRSQAQYDTEPLIQQQQQSNDWSDHNDRGESQAQPAQGDPELQNFETGQADYGSAQRKAGDPSSTERGDKSTKGDLSDDDIGDAAPPQAKTERDARA